MEEVAGQRGLVELLVKADANVHELGGVEERAQPCRLVVLGVEVQEVQHRLHNGAAVVLLPVRGEEDDAVDGLAHHAAGELHHGHDHGQSCPLDGDERLVHVDAHGVSGVEEPFTAGAVAIQFAYDLDKQLLGVSRSEVEADRLEY